MYSAKYTVMLLFLCICPTIIMSMMNRYRRRNSNRNRAPPPPQPPPPPPPPAGCVLSTVTQQKFKLPIVFTVTNRVQSIAYPDVNGNLNFDFNSKFRLLCAKTHFVLVHLASLDELEVTCKGNGKVMYRGQLYDYTQLECADMPKSKLVVIKDKHCQGSDKNNVASVGFPASGGLIVMYQVCFDTENNNPLYTWYKARRPYYAGIQMGAKRPNFENEPDLFKTNEEMTRLYHVSIQMPTVADILQSEDLMKQYIKKDNVNCLTRGHFMARADFYYGFEQTASYHYANTSPQWRVVNTKRWAQVEELVRQILINGINTDYYLIVTGTFSNCRLPDSSNNWKALFLEPPTSVPVAQYFWRLVFNYTTQVTHVFVALNNPYLPPKYREFMCPNTCPHGIRNDSQSKADSKAKLVYCCSLKGFEKAYGELDNIVYQ